MTLGLFGVHDEAHSPLLHLCCFHLDWWSLPGCLCYLCLHRFLGRQRCRRQGQVLTCSITSCSSHSKCLNWPDCIWLQWPFVWARGKPKQIPKDGVDSLTAFSSDHKLMWAHRLLLHMVVKKGAIRGNPRQVVFLPSTGSAVSHPRSPSPVTGHCKPGSCLPAASWSGEGSLKPQS